MIHPDTRVVYISAQLGNGLVAVRPLPRGTVTWVRDPLDVSWPLAEVQSWSAAYTPIVQQTCRRLDGEVVQLWDHARFINHGCEPNVAGTEFGVEVALRDIEAGEEVTRDYGAF